MAVAELVPVAVGEIPGMVLAKELGSGESGMFGLFELAPIPKEEAIGMNVRGVG